MASLLNLTLLGGFHAERDGEPITDFESNKVRALLAYLTVEANPHQHTLHQRARVASLLWPDYPEEVARTNLRHILHQLRQSLADDKNPVPLVLASRQTIQRNPQAAVEVDVNRFRTLLLECERCTHRTPEVCPACQAHYTEAAALYQGDFLVDLTVQESALFEEWVVVQRENLHRQALMVFFTLAVWHEAKGEYEQALAYAWRQLALEPWREEAHRQTMRVLAHTGQRPAALAQYGQCQKVLAEEIGVAPDPETTALYEQIRSGEFNKTVTDANITQSPNLLVSPSPSLPSSLQDWGEAPANSYFFGREAELTQLKQWLLGEGCKLVTVLALGGMGKSTLVTRTARALVNEFAFVFWRSLLNAPPLSEILRDLLHFLLPQQAGQLPERVNEQIALLFQSLRQSCCLLVLDNVESILEAGQAGQYRAGYENYGQLIERIAQSDHQSCLLLTSRERPHGIEQWEEDLPWVRTLQLSGLAADAGGALLKTRGLMTDPALIEAVVERYSGNPLALKLVARTIQELFDGDIVSFLSDDVLIFDDIRKVLDQQFDRLTLLERDLLVWLAIEREGSTVKTLSENLLQLPQRRDLVEALSALQRRSLLEKAENGFTLQNVVMEFVTGILVDRVCWEIEAGKGVDEIGDRGEKGSSNDGAAITPLPLSFLNRYALLKAQAKEYVRQSQIRQIAQPVAERLTHRLGSKQFVAHCKDLLDALRSQGKAGAPLAGYAGGNMLNLLLLLSEDLHGFDFSQLAIWQAHLRNARLQGVNFVGADLTRSVFFDTFGAVRTLAFSPDGQYLALTPGDESIQLWQVADRQQISVLHGHTNLVRSITFSPDGRWLASGAGHTHEICLWDVSDPRGGRLRHHLSGQPGVLWGLVFDPLSERLASISDDGAIRLWDLKSGQSSGLLRADKPHRWCCAAISPDGTLLASGSWDGALLLWDMRSGQVRQTLLVDTGNATRAVVFALDGRWLASAGHDDLIRIWDLTTIGQGDTGSAIASCRLLQGHTDEVWRLAFGRAQDSAGPLLVSGGNDRTIRVWRINDEQGNECVRVLEGHTDNILALAFAPDGTLLASGSNDQTIRLWDTHTWQTQYILQGYANRLRCVAFAADSATLASGGNDQTVRLWDLARLGAAAKPNKVTLRHTLRGHTDTVLCVAFAPQRAAVAMLATGSFDGTVRLWQRDSGLPSYTLAGHTGAICCVAFSADGSLLATGSYDHTLRLWSTRTGALIKTLYAGTETVTTVVFSPDNKHLAIASLDNTIRLWDIHTPTTPQLLGTFPSQADNIMSLVFRPNGEIIAAGGSGHTIQLWRLRTRDSAVFHTLIGHTSWVQQIIFSPDGMQLASAGDDLSIRLWDIDSGECLHTLVGHTAGFLSLAFAPLGAAQALLASCGVDETIRIWDTRTGECLHILGHPGPYEGMNIARVTGIFDGQRSALKALGAVEE